MYAEEYLPDDAIDYFDVSDVSIEETSSVDTDIRDQIKRTELNKRLDKDYYSYKINEFDGEFMKKMRIQVFSSPTEGKIRNAATGIRMEHNVGSKYESLYFVVKDTAVGTKTPMSSDPRKLFYNNPEECERHLRIALPQSVKAAFINK